MEKNVEKCTITVKHIQLSQDTSVNKIYDFDSTMMTKMLNKNKEEQLFDTKFLIIMNCKHGKLQIFFILIRVKVRWNLTLTIFKKYFEKYLANEYFVNYYKSVHL